MQENILSEYKFHKVHLKGQVLVLGMFQVFYKENKKGRSIERPFLETETSSV